MIKYGSYINGDWVNEGATFEDFSPVLNAKL